MANAILEQYGIHKMNALKASPFACLADSDIEQTPHQIEAFLSALLALKNGGIILADEVGLGKTIEAGLVIKYLIKNGAKRILIAMPPPLRKQWQIELEEKFKIKSDIPEKHEVNSKAFAYTWQARMSDAKPVVIITTYGYAPQFIKKFSSVKWDLFVFDEAHRLRNLDNGAKMPAKLFQATKHIPKVMLTATPLQNNLRELYALSKFIDERIFVSEKVFNDRFVKTEDYKELREVISPILHRTLRKDVAEYLKFSNRDCMLIDFNLTKEEAALYELANAYLQRPVLYAVGTQNRGLVTMVVRKLLASSSYAVAETFEVLKERLKVLKQNTKAEKAAVSLKGFFDLIDDDSDEYDDDDTEDLEEVDRVRYRNEIDDELKAVERIIQVSQSIKENSKAKAVVEALTFAFETQRENGKPEKALIFTESKRTQKYLVETLKVSGFDGILVFNGEISDPEMKKLRDAWRGRNPSKATNSPNVDLKQAIVETFEREAKILIATDIASEGLNLQFCNTVINYDLPWNPMKIEQRIGRCHRFGQTQDVWVYNLLNKQNEADRRVYEILEKKFNLFKGVFGASDEALGLLESGSGFEKLILEIYQKCKTAREFKYAFDQLEKEIGRKRGSKYKELKTLLNSAGSDSKKARLHSTKQELDTYLDECIFYEDVTKNNPEPWRNVVLELKNVDVSQSLYGIRHGYILVGVATTGDFKTIIAPVLCIRNERGNATSASASEIAEILKSVPQEVFRHCKLNQEETALIGKILDKLPGEFAYRYQCDSRPIIDYHRNKLADWAENRKNQYTYETQELDGKINSLRWDKERATNFQQKIDIQKEIDKLLGQLKKRDEKILEHTSGIERERAEEERAFNAQFDIQPFVLINAVVKF